jgi:hypothetical protein
VRSLERHVAVYFCFLALKTVSNQSGDKRTHFWPAETETNQTPGGFYSWMMDVVQGPNGGGPELRRQKRPERTCGDIT